MKAKILKKEFIQREVTLNGMMTFSKLNNGLHTADFQCCEDATTEPFTAQCKVQLMRDGNMYLIEQPRRQRNRALFRDDNSTLTLGHNGRFYFFFSLEGELIEQLPERLVSQSSAIAQKVIKELIRR